MRTLSDNFKNFLKTNEEIQPIIKQIKADSSLDCEIRNDKLQVYYRGAELFSIEEKCGKFYFTKSGNSIIKGQSEKICEEAVHEMVNITIPKRKNFLDLYGKSGPEGSEREAQQLIVRENNLNLKAEETDYYITDIEDSDSSVGLRFDMLAVRTLRDGKDRSTPPKKFAIIELKYSNGAVHGDKSSLKTHFLDLVKFIENESNLKDLKEQIRYLFNLKLELGFIQKPDVTCDFRITEKDLSDKPEYIIILANYKVNEIKQNSKLHDLLVEIKEDYPSVFDKFDVKFATSAFMGYGLYADYMISYDDFVNQLKQKKKNSICEFEIKPYN